MDLDADKIFRQEAHRLAALMGMAIDRQGEPPGSFRPLADKTRLARKHLRRGGGRLKRAKKTYGTKALIASGTMRNAITVVDTSKGAFVGIPRKARAKGGKKPYALALIHEYGTTIHYTITRKHMAMLRYIHAVLVPMWRASGGTGGGSSKLHIGGTMHIVIPARPFMRPAYEAWIENVPHALAEHLVARGFKKG